MYARRTEAVFSGRKRQRTAVAIFERVHLLADDVGFFTDASRKQRGFFKNRSANLVIVVSREYTARRGLHSIPDGARRRQNVASALHRSNHDCSSLYKRAART